MCRIDLCGQIGVKISSYGDRKFIKINPLNRPWGRFLRREDRMNKRRKIGLRKSLHQRDKYQDFVPEFLSPCLSEIESWPAISY